MKPKRDVIFLCQFFHPEYISSAQLPFDTAKALTEAGFTVDVLCGYPREYYSGAAVPAEENLDGIHIQRLKYLQLDRSRFLGRLINYFSFTLAVFLHLGKLSHYRSAVVYSNPPVLPWVACFARRLFGTKLVFVAYDLYPELAVRTGAIRQGSIICRLMDHINRKVFPSADRVVALSSEMKEYLAANRRILPEKISVIPNWYADQGTPQPVGEDNIFREKLAEKFVVSYFGNMGTIQDMDTILGAIRALKEEPDIFFLFAGHGNKLDALKEHLHQEGLANAEVLDYLHGKDYLDALQISSAALISLEKGTTGLCVPSKTYSYMMQGIPLIAIMDPCDIVRDIERGAGRWLQNGDSPHLAEIIRQMRDDPQSVKAMQETCRRLYLEKYTTQVCTGQYVDLFRAVLEQPG